MIAAFGRVGRTNASTVFAQMHTSWLSRETAYARPNDRLPRASMGDGTL